MEASIFFSYLFWNQVDHWRMYLESPLEFCLALALASVLATALFHLTPAYAAARFGSFQLPLIWIPVSLAIAAYVYFLVELATKVPALDNPWLRQEVFALAAVFILFAASGLKSWWKGGVLILLTAAALIFALSLTENWRGVGLEDRFLAVLGPAYLQVHFYFPFQLVQDSLLFAAPCIVPAWRIGLTQPRPSHTWLTGSCAVALPLVVAVILVRCAEKAGINLHYHPSLQRDFAWVLCGHKPRLGQCLYSLTMLTLLSPALLYTYPSSNLHSHSPKG